MNYRYVEIIPTHRPNFIIKCLGSIFKQKTKPDKIIIIIDSIYKQNEISDLIFMVNNFSTIEINIEIDIVIKNHYESGTAIKAFKNCFYEANIDNNLFIETKNYYHIMEDDVEYLRNVSITKYIELINKNYDFIYSPLIDIHNGEIINGEMVLTKGLQKIIELPETILDTCSIIFNGEHLNGFCEYIKDKDYVLNGDMYFFKWFLYNSNKPISIIETYIASTIHNNQVTSSIFNQVLGTQYVWYNTFPYKNKRLKYEARLMNNYSIRAAIDNFKINLENTIETFPTKTIIKELIRFQKNGISKNIIDYEKFLNDHKQELKWLLKIELNDGDIDYHPNLRYLQDLK